MAFFWLLFSIFIFGFIAFRFLVMRIFLQIELTQITERSIYPLFDSCNTSLIDYNKLQSNLKFLEENIDQITPLLSHHSAVDLQFDHGKQILAGKKNALLKIIESQKPALSKCCEAAVEKIDIEKKAFIEDNTSPTFNIIYLLPSIIQIIILWHCRINKEILLLLIICLIISNFVFIFLPFVFYNDYQGLIDKKFSNLYNNINNAI